MRASRREGSEKREVAVALAIDKDKASEYAIKWIADHLFTKPGQPLTLLHVHVKQPSSPLTSTQSGQLTEVNKNQNEDQAKDLFLPFRCFCTKKAIKSNEVIVEDADIAKALINYVAANSIQVLVLGAPSKNSFGFFRFKAKDIPSTVSKGAPDFCTVYVIGKGKITHCRPASAELPSNGSRNSQHMRLHQHSREPESALKNKFRPALTRATPIVKKSYEPLPDIDLPPVSSEVQTMDRILNYDSTPSKMTHQSSSSSELDSRSSLSSYSGTKFIDMTSAPNGFSSSSFESGRSWSSQNRDDMEAEMRRLRLELKQTMEMYSMACKEAISAKHREKELQQWKLNGKHRLEEARLAEEAACALARKEKAKSKVAIEAAQAAERVAELEAERRKNSKMKALEKAKGKKSLESKGYDLRYRRYTIEDIEAATNYFSQAYKIGEGGYGPVYRGELDHTPVAIKVLRPDAAQGRCIRHPNMVLLLGACPEFGCLVYEYMANGSLEDRLFRKGHTPVIPWQLRFRIAAEIATGLLFLHQTKPEPVVHRDLKPGNILLDHNYVSKISDVGLARLVPPSVANAVTQYHVTSMAGTFCYIDPEYQQTGMLGVKSDVYSLGVMLLQLITAQPPMGLTFKVEDAIESGTFAEMLDPDVPDWPVEEALKFAQLALQCAEMRRKDRPDLGKVVLPELNRLRALADDRRDPFRLGGNALYSPRQDVMSDRLSGYHSRSSTSSYAERMFSGSDKPPETLNRQLSYRPHQILRDL
ncbi:U-box domain-containing protein 35-like [Pyrus ussuriensis x Pyrus communis]|uniref:RING-type E3 ubiquitin transferase n=1 Tax=Pyrus ussuriensis x Pyrus communis TaxID=2448454 RepID=A0A5N5GL32_9ROSA|nr:U-box domain-containing protein 35-like [Pyrus ussuriensis x Pyrus communis]